MGGLGMRVSGERIRKLVSGAGKHAPAALSVAANAAAGVAARVGTMTATVARNLAARRGNIPVAELFGKIPQGVRMGGENSILAYLKKVDLSHIRSVRNSPELAHSADNVVFEFSFLNQARGARDMTAPQRAAAKANNTLSGLKAGLRGVPTAAVRAGLLAGAMELPISGTVNAIRCRRGTVTRKEAACNIARDVLITSAAGGAAGGCVVVLAAIGAPISGTALIVASGLGGAAYLVSSADRILRATREAGCPATGFLPEGTIAAPSADPEKLQGPPAEH